MPNFEEIVEGLPDEAKGIVKAAFLAANPIAGIKTKEEALEWAEKHPIFKPAIDYARTKGIESHKKKFMDSEFPDLVEAEIKKRDPNTDPVKAELSKIRSELAEEKANAKREKLRIHALKLADTTGIPADIAEDYIGEDEEGTTNLFTAKAKSLIEWADKRTQKRIDESGVGNRGAPRNGTTTAPDVVKQYNELKAQGRIDEANALWIKSQGLMK